MKNLVLAILLVIGTAAIAQKAPMIRLNIFTSYAFDDKVDSYYSSTDYYRGTMKGGFEWGGGLEFMVKPYQGIELFYLRLNSTAPMEYYNATVKYTTFDVASNYIILGSNHYFSVNPKVEPYAGLNLGMGIFNVSNPDNGKSGSSTKFAWGIKAGINIWATDKVGLKIQGGMLSAVQAAGGGLYFGTGGAGAGVSTYSTFYQWSIGGGLTFKLGQK